MVLTALLVGLLGSFHCVGMCGPIAFMLPLDRTNIVTRTLQIMLYHVGRLVAYLSMGIVFGFVGKRLYLFGMQQTISIVIGVLMILIVISPKHIIKKVTISQPFFRLINYLKKALGVTLKRKTPDAFLSIGLLNGFLPCGLVYIAIFGAIATNGSVSYSMVYMLFFGLGTIPLMTVTALLGNVVSIETRKKIRKIIPVIIIVMGGLFVLRGLGLGIPYISPENIRVISTGIECH